MRVESLYSGLIYKFYVYYCLLASLHAYRTKISYGFHLNYALKLVSILKKLCNKDLISQNPLLYANTYSLMKLLNVLLLKFLALKVTRNICMSRMK